MLAYSIIGLAILIELWCDATRSPIDQALHHHPMHLCPNARFDQIHHPSCSWSFSCSFVSSSLWRWAPCQTWWSCQQRSSRCHHAGIFAFDLAVSFADHKPRTAYCPCLNRSDRLFLTFPSHPLESYLSRILVQELTRVLPSIHCEADKSWPDFADPPTLKLVSSFI